MLPSFTVEGNRITSAPPYRKTVFDSAVLERNSGRSLAEVLEERGPVFIKDYGEGQLATPSIRGTGAQHTQVYWNGIPLNSSTHGQSDLALVPLSVSDRIEVHHGGASLVDGSGGLGGSIQLRSRYPDTLERYSAQVKGGSFGKKEGLLRIANGNADWKFRTRGWYKSAENDYPFKHIAIPGTPERTRKNAAYAQYGLLQELYYAPGDQDRIAIKGWFLNNEKQIPATLLTGTSEQEQHDNKIRGLAEWEHRFRNGHFSLKSAFLRDRIDYRDPEADIRSITLTRNWHNRFRISWYPDERTIVKSLLSHELAWARSDGFESARRRGTSAAMIRVDRRTGQFLQWNVTLREERIGKDWSPFQPAAGFELQLPPMQWLRIKGNASRMYRKPDMNDLYWEPGGNPELLPEKGWSYEAGIAYEKGVEKTPFRAEGEITAFSSEVTNWIQWAPNNSGLWTPGNLRDVVSKGIEASTELYYEYETLDIKLTGAYHLNRSVNRTTGENTSIPEGDQLIYVPKHRWKFVGHLAWSGYELVYKWNYTERRYITTDNSTWLPSYHLNALHLNKGFGIGKNQALELSVDVQNLFDVDYQAVAWRPLPGRHYEVGLKWRFKE